MSTTLEKFKNYLDEIQQYFHVNTLLYWDMRTTAPKLGLEANSDAIAYFSTKEFALKTSEELGKMLNALSQPEEFSKLDDTMKFVVTKMKKDYEREKRIPADFYEEFVRAQNASEMAWEVAKPTGDFPLFAPHLEKIIDFTKKMTAYTDPDKEVYDALLDTYEEGMTSEKIDVLFEEMKAELIPLVKKILAAPQPDDTAFMAHFDIEAQKQVQKILLEYIGFSFDAGAVGETEHPFTLNFNSKDVRVTNHYYENDVLSAIFSAIHEGGHGIFEQNVNPDYDKTVAGSCCHMGIHESQSRFYENILGRNINFWVPIYPKIQEVLPSLKNVSLEDFYREINHVRNSFIRVEADELTYCFHIILRYEMEKEIFRNNTPVDELPALWNQKMQEYLGITPSNDGEGILQDTHWSDGSFGYFPSYLLGTIYDGMFLEAMEAELGDINTILREGRIAEITKWLNEKIHRFGSTRTSNEVITAVCHKEVTAKPIIKFFKEKYNELYGI